MLDQPLLPVTPPRSAWHRTLQLLWGSAKPRSRSEILTAAAVLALLLLSKLLNLALPLLLRLVLDALSADEALSATAPLVLLYCGLHVCSDGCTQLQSALWGRLSFRITQRVSCRLFEHLHALSLRWHLNRKTGEVLAAMNQGVGAVAALLQVATFSISATMLELLLTSAVFAKIGVPAISLCVVGGAALYTWYTVALTTVRLGQRRAVNEASKRAQDVVVDSLLNFETVKLFAAEAAEARRYGDAAAALSGLQAKAQASLSLLNFGQTAAMQVGMLGGLLVACAAKAEGKMSVGDFVMVQLYITQLFRPLSNLGGNYRQLTQSLTDVEKMAELLAVPAEVEDLPGAADLRAVVAACPPEQRDVAFESVCFRYAGPDSPGVASLSLRIRPGGSVALVGPSGSGKSTSTRLLCRLLEAQAGRIAVCGRDVRSVTQHSLRSVVSCVSQETVLFNASVRMNLVYGAPDASDSEIEAACALARVDSYLARLEKGLETAVGERGLRLSGGEKQRLGIARALLRGPAVLVLDEATSALDTETEREVQDALDAAAHGRCTLAIAHRLSTIVNVDEILMLKGGEVVERGPHKALLELPGGLYASMWSRQANLERSRAASGGGRLSCKDCKCCNEECCKGCGA